MFNSKKKQIDKKEIFENMPEFKAILTLSVPTIISGLISVIYNIADTFFVGRTGNPYMVGGVSLSLPLLILTASIGNLFGIGGGSLISRRMGAGQPEEAKRISVLSLYGALVSAFLFSMICLVFMNPILGVLGASENTILYSQQYTTWVLVAGGIPVIVSAVSAHLLRNVGYSSQASFGLSGGGVLNIILDPLFMFVLFPDGDEALAAAVATFVSNVCACIFLVSRVISVSKKAPLSIDPKLLRKITKDDISQTCNVGIPSALLPGLLDVANIIMNASMAAHGDFQLAAMGIVMKAERIPSAINIGLSQGMLPLVAYNYSSGNHERMNRVIKKTRILGLSICAVSLILYEFFAPGFVGIFLSTSNKAVSDAAATLAFATVFLRLRAAASPVQFINYHTSYCMQAMGDGKDTLLHSFIRVGLFYIPLMLILNRFFGENGLALSLFISEALADFVALFLLKRWIKKEKK